MLNYYPWVKKYYYYIVFLLFIFIVHLLNLSKWLQGRSGVRKTHHTDCECFSRRLNCTCSRLPLWNQTRNIGM